MNKKPIIVSGFQPTGNLHVGNYLGAVKNIVDLQNSGKYDVFIFIADYHSLTGNMDADRRREQIVNMAAELLAAGVDPKKSTFFVQSHVPEHTELGWIFNTVTPVAELERMTQFKDKSSRQEKNINSGLLTYPILQAADILLYHGAVVPVGQDQIQHVELTRDIARFFNHRYGQYFPETKHLLTQIPKVMSLLEPTKKMSKSLGENHVIELADEPETIEKKLKKAVTASEAGASSPGVNNLLSLLNHFGEQSLFNAYTKAEKEGSIRYGDLKKDLTLVLSNYFAHFRTERAKFLKHPKHIHSLLEEGAKKAQAVSQKTMKDVRKLVGIR